jgi:hypothetical protein
MSTYAQVADLVKYTTLRLRTADENLQSLMDNAEQDLDNLFNPLDLTDSLQGITMSGQVTGGSWGLGLEWLDSMYSVDGIPWDASGRDVIDALNAMTTAWDQVIQGPSWMIPETPVSAPDWAYGPLPGSPVVVQATSYLGGQVLPLLVVTNSLEGVNPQVTATQLRGGGTRWDIWQLQPAQVAQLRRACCAQAEYRDQMGEDFFTKAQWQSVSGPEFSTQGKLPIIGPKVHRELAGSGLVQYSVRASVSTSRNVAAAYTRVGGTPIPDDWRAV